MFYSMLRRLSLARSKDRPARRRPQPLRLGVELLEAREVPAVAFALTDVNSLLRFDTATPATTTAIAITGLQTGTEHVLGIDFRPRTGQLMAATAPIGSVAAATLRTYSINPLTGAATFIGTVPGILPGAGDRETGFDFNPTVDRIRFVQSNNENARINPNNGTLAGNDPDLTFTSPATGAIIAEAYDRNFDRPNATVVKTTLYGIDRGSSMLVVQGGVDGAGPGGANGGVITAIGALGFTLSAANDGGFDIMDSPDNGGLGTAFAALTTGANVTNLYTINLATGAATLLGTISAGTTEILSLAIVPDSALVVGSGAGATGDVRSLNPTSGALRQAIASPFPGFQGATRVASGDVNADGIPDVIVSAVFAQGHVKVFGGSTGQQLPGALGSFFAFPGFGGTINVGAGDVNGDTYDDVLVVANGANGHVKAFSGKDGSLIASFFAFPGFLGNVTIAAADFNNDGAAEIVTTAASNGHTKVFTLDGTLFTGSAGFVNSFFAYASYLGDVSVAAGDVNGDGIADFVFSSGAGTALHVRAYSGRDATPISSFLVNGFGANFLGGASVGLTDVNSDGRLDIAVTPGAGTQANVIAFDGLGTQLATYAAFADFQGGATIAGTQF